MAPAIVHFLFGASLSLSAAALLAARYPWLVRYRLPLVAAGGLWGLTPDLHHVSPVAAGPLRAAHRSRPVDLFALHWTLDRPAVRDLGDLSILLAVVGFAAVVVAFELAVSRTSRTR